MGAPDREITAVSQKRRQIQATNTQIFVVCLIFFSSPWEKVEYKIYKHMLLK